MNFSHPGRTICERLALVRRRTYGLRGKSRFARELGIGPSTYDRYERDRLPPADLLALASRLTGTRLEWLITGEGAQEEPPPSDRPQANAVAHKLRTLLHHRPELAATIESFLSALAASHVTSQSQASIPAAGRGADSGHPAHVVTSRVDLAAPAGPSHDAAARVGTDDLIPVVGSTAAGLARFWDEVEHATIGPQADARLEQVLGDYERQSVHASGALRAGGAPEPRPVSLVQFSRAATGGFLEFLAGTGIRDRYPTAVAWRIDGESMSPRYEDGDFVVTSAVEPAVVGHPCVARQRGQIGVNCKLFQRQGDEVVLVPVNERYGIQRFPVEQLQWAQRVLYAVRLS